MRVLLVIPSITNFFTFLEELTAEAQSRGIEVGLVASPEHFQSVTCYRTLPGCKYFPIALPQGMNPLAHMKAARALRRVVADFRPDWVHAHIGAAIFSTSLARSRNWPKVMATHHGLLGPSMAGWKGRIASMAERWTLGRVDVVCLLNTSDQEWLAQRKCAGRVYVYPSMGLGCRTEIFDPSRFSDAWRQDKRAELGIAPNDLVFVFVGRHVWFKGFDLVVKGFHALRAEVSGVKLLLLGEPYRVHPTGLDDDERQHLLEHPDVIRVGWVKEVEEFLAIADINVFPSEREGMPVNLMESLAMGVPVITRDTRGCRDVVTDGETGYLLRERSLHELIGRMRELTEQSALRRRMSEAALAEREKLDRSHWIEAQLSLYNGTTV